MQFEVRVRKLIDNDKPLKAGCSVTVGGMFAAHNIKVIKTDKDMFIGMPFETHTDKDGNEQRRDVFHLISSEVRKAMEEAVIAVVISALLLAGLYALFNTTIMPTVTSKITSLFSYSGT